MEILPKESMLPKKKKCEKSPDGNHCWHSIPPTTVFILRGTNEVHEFCCWCPETRSYKIEPVTGSYSINIKKHGPNYREVVYYKNG